MLWAAIKQEITAFKWNIIQLYDSAVIVFDTEISGIVSFKNRPVSQFSLHADRVGELSIATLDFDDVDAVVIFEEE
ncbi:hypothetical protein D3C87_1631530 [compost metagenome]